MKGKGVRAARRGAAGIALAAFWLALTPARVAAARERVHITPKFRPGDTLYYQIEMHTISTGQTTTPIINPEGGTKFSENVGLLVRLDVLPIAGARPSGEKTPQDSSDGPVRLRVTYVRAHADSESDAPAFDTPRVGRDYDRLQGHSFEFTMEPGGTIADFQDVDNILPNSVNPAQVFSWMKTLASGSGLPQRGIVIGQKWTGEKPLSSAPLTGLVWKAESTYLRNEACGVSLAASGAGGGKSKPAGECAVILTQFQILRRGSKHSDETPPDYLRHGLRTSGTMNGSGESLDSVSLATGLLASSTQSSTQHVDFDIISAANGEKVHRVGELRTQTIIRQVAEPPPDTGSQP
jgi:hypothetical protein